MLQSHFIKAQVVGKRIWRRSARVENVVALIVVALTGAVLFCLAAIAPAVWTFAAAAAAGTSIPAAVTQCLSINGNSNRLACYDELARRPAKGRNPLSGTGTHDQSQIH
jgi:hypothetical protein